MKIELIDFSIKGNEKGSLIALEANKNIPFEIKRVYYIFNTKKKVRRGFHAHKNLQQVLIAVNGKCKILLDNGKEKETCFLDSPNKGLIIKNMVWREMFDFSRDCVLMVLADSYYDETDYIRDYKEFLEMTSN